MAGSWVPANQLVKVTNDTLTIHIEFDDGLTLASASSATALQSLDSQTLYPLSPAAHHDPAMENVFDNAALSDFAFIAEGKPIYVQKHLLLQKSPHGKFQTISVEIRHPLMEVCSNPPAQSIPLNVFPTQATLHYIHFSRFCIQDDSRYLNPKRPRRMHVCLDNSNAVELLLLFGHESDTVQELIVSLICKEFGAVRETTGFQSLLSSFVEPGDREEQCMKSKRFLAVLRRLKTGTAAMSGGKSRSDALFTPAVMDPVRSVAFRQLLSTPSVADVRFLIEGKVVFAQKCVLSSLSDFFRSMFSGAWSEGGVDDQDRVSVVRIEDFSHATFVAMLNYIYLLELDPDASLMELGLLCGCADKYQITNLSSLALNRISYEMCPETLSHFFFAYAYRYEVLYILARGSFVRNFNLVRKSTEFVRVVRSYWEYEDAIRSGIWTKILMQFTEWGYEAMMVLPEESGGVDDLLQPSEDADSLDSTEMQENPLPVKMDACVDGCAGEGAETDSVSVRGP
ncbi:hypothetical protein BJ741DRAFT_681487 [Chytriomyces cf. hyalinus JEL632]|nr:hypothetical protein BJ741DRAFT_681487 [Chytriomyces cf. hyalinus JEL632]